MVPPPLRFDILKEIEKRIPGFPIVLHGSSSVPQDKVAIINKYGGALKDAIGIPEDQLREAAKSAVCKINIDSDGRLAMTAAVREIFATKPAEFDPRKYLGPARDSLRELYKHKLTDVLGSGQYGKINAYQTPAAEPVFFFSTAPDITISGPGPYTTDVIRITHEPEYTWATTRKRVVVIGGGFGGMKLIDSLRRSGFQLVLIDQNNYHQFQPLLYQVATAGLNPGSIAFPFRKDFRHIPDFHFRMGPGHPDRSPGKSDRNDDR